MLGRRRTGLEEVGAEVDHEVGAGQVEERLAGDAEQRRRRVAERLGRERLVHDAAAGADRRDPRVEHRAGGRTGVAAEDPGAVAGLLDLRGERLQRGVPGHRTELAVGAALKRTAVAIGMVGAADRRLAARAQRALVDGMRGIALELDRAAFARLHVETARRGTFLAGRGVVVRDAGHDLVGLHHVRDQLVDRLAADRGGGASGRSDELQEFAAVEFGHPAS
jgi:hypothetical protein